jgi:hypothetical protein
MVIRQLSAGDPVSEFQCRMPQQTAFLRERALLFQQSELGRTYVLPAENDEPPALLGYYVVCMARLQATDVDPSETRTPAYPVALLAQLARDERSQAGLGEQLIADAFRRIARIADEIGCAGILLHAKTPELVKYYEGIGFRMTRRKATEQAMFLPIATLRATLVSIGNSW